MPPLLTNERTARFLEAHKVEENKFGDFPAASAFFEAKRAAKPKKKP